jgi:nucleotide-binding universal stress UspA family protein
VAEEVPRVLVVGADRRSARVPAARRLLRDPGGPIAVAAPGLHAAPPQLRTVAVAFDGSRAAEDALTLAVDLACGSGAAVELLWVDTGGPHPLPPEDREAWARSVLREAATACPRDLECRTRILHGDPAGELAAAARDADVLCCGTHGRGAFSAAVLGSVTADLVQRMPTSLLVAPAHRS